jgi:hypothetical protein
MMLLLNPGNGQGTSMLKKPYVDLHQGFKKHHHSAKKDMTQ